VLTLFYPTISYINRIFIDLSVRVHAGPPLQDLRVRRTFQIDKDDRIGEGDQSHQETI